MMIYKLFFENCSRGYFTILLSRTLAIVVVYLLQKINQQICYARIKIVLMSHHNETIGYFDFVLKSTLKNNPEKKPRSI